jgi:hypothetical protein
MGKLIPFNPLDKRNLGASVAEALLTSTVHELGRIQPFNGAGVYAIYYSGKFKPYAKLAARNRNDLFEAPIYVGKAVPKGARHGGNLEAAPGRVMFNRLKEHAESIRLTSNLFVDDFHCRFLVVDDIWIPLGETLIISRFVPIWNRVVDGFGNHDPGSGRAAGLRPRWDVLHPGRPWANKLRERSESQTDIAREAVQYLENAPLHASSQFIEPED